MKELDLMKEMLDRILDEAAQQGIREIRAVEVVIGESFPFPPKELKYWMTELARGTPAGNAKFSFKKGKVKNVGYIISEITG